MNKRLHRLLARCRKLRVRRRGFNLVEVTLSIGVIAFGMTGVFAMCTAGMKAARDSIGETYAVMIAEHMFAAAQAGARSDKHWANGFYVSDKMGSNLEPKQMIEENMIGIYAQTMPASSMKSGTIKNKRADDFDMVKLGTGSPGQYGAWRASLSTQPMKEFKKSLGDDESGVIDFSCDVRVWISGDRSSTANSASLYYMFPYVSGSADNYKIYLRKERWLWDACPKSEYADAQHGGHSFAGLYVEVSWPIDRDLSTVRKGKTYYLRNRRVFYKEIFR